jgi:hypothetical protein
MLKWCDHDRRFKEFTEFINAVVFGTLHYNEGRFLYAYDTHLREVCDYFEDRAGDLLIMDICGGDGWEKLCPFLGVPVPSVPFPDLNKGKNKHSVRAWITELERAADDIAALIPVGDVFILVDESKFGSKVAQFYRLLGRARTHVDSHRHAHRKGKVMPLGWERGELLTVPCGVMAACGDRRT